MALAPRLEVRQSQSLTLTPQLMQSIRLLQLSHLELTAFVDTELLRNPLLERDDSEPEPLHEEAPAAPVRLDDDTLDHAERPHSGEEIAAAYDTAVENVFPDEAGHDRPPPSTPWQDAPASGEGIDLDQFVATRPSLYDHLTRQAGLLLKQPAEQFIAQALINNVDEAGYLTVTTGQVAEQLGTGIGAVDAVLARLQQCEPAGLMARNLAECLALQLADQDRLDPMMQRLLANLELLASHDLIGLIRVVGCERDDFTDMLAELRRLDPKPGRRFDTAPLQAVVPDVFVRRGHDGDWLVELNSDVLPRVLVNRSYYATVSAGTRDGEERAFLAECLSSATWLAKSLDQRAQTIVKVAGEIVRQQAGFLSHGVAHLRPMTLRMVADSIAMHESTISRVTSNKYVATPRGLFEMKYFFTTALASVSGDADHSAEAVRHRIRQLIEAEHAARILSDDTIADMLKSEQGVDVARRTVAKYREGMNIPSSVIRRRQKKAMPVG